MWIVRNCLIACCLFCSSMSFARNLSQLGPALPEQTVELQNPASTESTDSNGSETTAAVQDAAPTSDPQDSANGSAGTSGSASTSASGSGSAPATTTSTPYVFP